MNTLLVGLGFGLAIVGILRVIELVNPLDSDILNAAVYGVAGIIIGVLSLLFGGVIKLLLGWTGFITGDGIIGFGIAGFVLAIYNGLDIITLPKTIDTIWEGLSVLLSFGLGAVLLLAGILM